MNPKILATTRLWNVLIVFVLTLAMIVLGTINAFAQTTGAGTISGTVRDPKDAVIPGTAITIHNTQTGIDRSISTNEVGVYSAPFLPPGQYEVTAVKPGFATLVRKNVSLQVG